MKKFIVKSTEEEFGEEFIEVTFPVDTTKDEANKVFKMAEAYSKTEFRFEGLSGEANPDEYDEYFGEMLSIIEDTSGQGAFEYYLKRRGCEISEFKPDFEYEW